ncbi:hypothetical protein C7378_0219 [Acidipila rosea]|uniref:Uncharacterized protein n=1 Tax=Acidipila rosea TaxID=768535 RepID=A0A4R1LF09_9BACT|nr:hypothetical protein C7378_0219 [Acidipila rosea]
MWREMVCLKAVGWLSEELEAGAVDLGRHGQRSGTFAMVLLLVAAAAPPAMLMAQ